MSPQLRALIAGLEGVYAALSVRVPHDTDDSAELDGTDRDLAYHAVPPATERA